MWLAYLKLIHNDSPHTQSASISIMLKGRNGGRSGVQALVESLKEEELDGTFQLIKLVAASNSTEGEMSCCWTSNCDENTLLTWSQYKLILINVHLYPKVMHPQGMTTLHWGSVCILLTAHSRLKQEFCTVYCFG